MKRKRSIPKIRTQVRNAIERKERVLEALQGETNPQLVETRLRCRGQLTALEAIEEALDGEMFLLNTLAGKVL